MESESNNTDCDYLTCGRCLREFPLQNITNFIHHKKNDCDPDNDDQNKNTDSLGRQLYCSSCTKAFLSAWDMLQHAQFTHNFKIFFDANRQVRLETSTIPAAISTPSEDQNSFIKEAPEVTPSIEPALFPLKQEVSEPTSPPRSTDQQETTPVDTSQEMQCCSSVVPKKRKQHMEASHSSTDGGLRDRISRRNEAGLRIGRKRTFSGNQYYLNRNPHGYGKYSQMRSSFGQNRLQYGQSRNHSSSTTRKYPSTIYIDVEHENPVPDSLSSNQENNKLPYHQEIYLDENEVKGADRKELGTQNMIGNSGSFILQPGTVFSIPFSYPVHSETTVSSASNPAVYTTCSTNTYPSEQCKSSSSLSSSSGEGNVTTSRIQGSNVQELNPSSNSKSFVTSQLIKNSSISNSQMSRSDTVLNQGRHSLSRLSLGFARSAKMGSSSLQRSKENQLTLEQQARKRKYPTSRPFKCDQCDHAFNQRIHLKKHLSKHTGVKPFKCGQCDYSTVERSHLKVHIRIHTGEKPFKCTFCEYATAQNSTLKIHLKRHHGSHMYSCQSCGKQFATKDSYMDHQAEHGSGSSNLLNPSVVIETAESTVALNKHEPSRPQAEKNDNINDSWPGGLLKK